MNNNFEKESILYIKTKFEKNKSIIADSYFTAPFKIAKPFYEPDKKTANIILMSASAGVMEGDCYKINMDVGMDSAVSLQGQSFSKIHKMETGYARQDNNFVIRENAFFDYDPKPTIPFAGSSFISNSVCYLEKGAQYIFSEILSCGREKSGERFQFRQFRNSNRVYYCNKLIFLDNQFLVPATQKVEGTGFLEGYTHQATLAYFSENNNCNLVEKINDLLDSAESEVEAGVSTLHKNGVIVRILGYSSDFLEKIIAGIRKEIYKCRPITAFHI